MNKLSILVLCIMLCGCTTFSKAELKKHDIDIYQKGFNKGFKCGYMSAILNRLKRQIEKAESLLDY